jgi:hypothetical protein
MKLNIRIESDNGQFYVLITPATKRLCTTPYKQTVTWMEKGSIANVKTRIDGDEEAFVAAAKQ